MAIVLYKSPSKQYILDDTENMSTIFTKSRHTHIFPVITIQKITVLEFNLPYYDHKIFDQRLPIELVKILKY